MAGEWGAISKATLSYVLRWSPGFVLRWWYPIRKCNEYLTVSAHGVGPHIYVNADRSPAIAGLNLTLTNGLPFEVKADGIHLELSLESRTLTNSEQAVKEAVPACGVRQISVNEIHLSDGQAKIVRQHQGESAILQVRGHVQFAVPLGEGKKDFAVETRAFIYRG